MGNLEKYLKSEDGYIQITPEIKALASKITTGAKNDAEKARKIYNHVREIKYFISPSAPSSHLINRDVMDCGSKHTLHASLLRAEGIPARINIMECPLEGVANTIEHIPLPPTTQIILGTLFSAIGQDVKFGTHYALDAYYDEKWNFQDSTMNPRLCNFFTGSKREACLSDRNASALLDCKKIGHTEDLPSNGVIISTLGKMTVDYMDKFGFGLKKKHIEKANNGVL